MEIKLNKLSGKLDHVKRTLDQNSIEKSKDKIIRLSHMADLEISKVLLIYYQNFVMIHTLFYMKKLIQEHTERR